MAEASGEAGLASSESDEGWARAAEARAADVDVAAALGGDDGLVGYRLRTVRVGVRVTALVLATFGGFALLPGHGHVQVGVFGAALGAGALAAAVIAVLPWARLFEGRGGQWVMYAWSAGDIGLMSLAVGVTGGGRSELWIGYTLTTLFFAASYPSRGQGALLALTGVSYVATLAATGWVITPAALFLRLALLLIVFVMAMFLARELRAEMERRSEAGVRTRLAEAQARHAAWFRSLVHEASDIVTGFDVEGRLQYVSPAMRTMGYEPEALVGTFVGDLVHPDDLIRVTEQITEQIESGGTPAPIEYRARHADGSWRYLEGVATNLLDEPTTGGVVVNARDVTDRKRAEMLLAGQSRVLEQIAGGAPLAHVLKMIAGMVEEHVDAQCAIVVRGSRVVRFVVLSEDATAAPNALTDEDLEGPGWSREITGATEGQVAGAVRLRFASRRFPTTRERQVAEVAANLAAIALERDATEARLAHQARHDPLTGLANRHMFMEALEHALTRTERDGMLAVLFVDLDGFKDINDRLGHHVGDEVLVALGRRLAGSLRTHDTLARFGGDEFVALCHVDGPEHAQLLADRLIARVSDPITVSAQEVVLTASVGITFSVAPACPSDTAEPEAMTAVQHAADKLLRDADAAMYRAKQRGGSQAAFYNDTNEPPASPARAVPS